jgi:diguanylate cyclase (GGDEF)-like protein
MLAVIGEHQRGRRFLDSYQTIIEKTPTEGWRWAQFLAHRAWFLVETDPHCAELDEVCAAFDALDQRPNRIALQVRHFYLARARGWLERLRDLRGRDAAETRGELDTALRQLARSASHPALRCHTLVLEASILQHDGRWRRAARMIERAQQLAARHNNLMCLHELHLLRAAHFDQEGLKPSARREAASAYAIAVENGWRPRASRVAQRHGFTEAGPATTASGRTQSASSTASDLRLGQYFDGLLQVSLAMGPTHDVSGRARQALDAVVKILAAERAFLFLDDGQGRLELRAARSHDGTDLGLSAPHSRTVVKQVQQTRRPVLFGVGTDDGAIAAADSVVAHDLRSIMAAPLLLDDRLLGVMVVDSRLASGVFAVEHVDILQAIANHISVALESARTARLEVEIETERTRRELAEGLRAVTVALTSTLNLGDVLERVLEGLEVFVHSDRSAVLLTNDDGFEVAASRGFDEGRTPRGAELPIEVHRLRSIVAEGRPHVFPQGGLPAPHDPPLSATSSCLAVPLVTRGEAVGILTIERKDAPALGEGDLELAKSLGGQAAVAIDNARLFGEVRKQAITDPLTGLGNRRHFFNLAAQEIKHARRYGSAYSVMIIDIDHFKNVNDTWGHAAGDLALVEIASRIVGKVRDVDIPARFGGEEFVVLLPETGIEGAKQAAERVRRAVGDTPVCVGAETLTLTVSIGVATAQGHDETLDQVIRSADDALYAAKTAGRDQVIVAGDS